MHMALRAKRTLLNMLILAGMLALLIAMIVSYRTRAEEIEQLRGQLDTLNAQCYTESMRGNALTSQINQADTDAFIERIARREYGYTNAGEVHYKVSNLPPDVLLEDIEVAVEAQ